MTRRHVFALVAFCGLMVIGRVGWDSSRAYQDGRQFEASGEGHEAAVRYGRSIHMYLPLLPVPHRASERLVALAQAAEVRGELAEARFCWEELRSGWLAVRSSWQPGQRWVIQAEGSIAALILADLGAEWPSPDGTAEERESTVREALAAREDPSSFWVLVMGLGWALWLGAAGTAIWRGIPADDDAPIAWSAVRNWAAISLGGYVVWLAGLGLA